MRILIIGAGVTGSLFASYLVSSRARLEARLKEEVEIKLLARGETYKRLRENGLKVHHVVQKITTIDSIPVIPSIENGDVYDYVLIFLRKTQILPLIDDLKSNRSAMFLFMGNNGTGLEGLVPPLHKNKVELGFPGSGGRRDGDTVYSVHGTKPVLYCGKTPSNKKNIQKLKRVMRIAGCSLKTYTNIDAWLKQHLALIIPLVRALSLDGGDNVSLSENSELLTKAAKAVKEGSASLKRLGYPRIPRKLMFFLLLPSLFLRKKIVSLLRSPMGKLLVYDHCMAAPEEMSELTEQLKYILKGDEKVGENLKDLL